MEKRRLGRNGEDVSVIGFGAWPIGGGMGAVDERAAIATVHAAIDAGITLIDTAQAYRSSQELLGKALSGGRRDKVFLATKASFDFSRAGLRTALEDSLRELRTECIDLYQLHAYRDQWPIEESMDELARFRDEGKIRFIGVSNFSAEQMQRALRAATFESSQPRYNMFDRDIEAADIPFCRTHGIGILAHSVFAKGLLTGRYRPDHEFSSDDERAAMPRFQGATFRAYLDKAERIREIASGIGVSLVQLAIAWVLRDPAVTCALAGAKSPEQIAEQARAGELHLEDEVVRSLDRILGK